MICCKNIVNITFFFNSSPDFGNHYFFFFPFLAMALPQLPQIFSPYFSNGITTIGFRSAGLSSRNFGNVITEIQNFLSPTFSLSLSYFCWISATMLPKFTLFPSNLSVKFKFELIITNHLWFVVKILWT